MLPADAVAEVGHQFVHNGLWSACRRSEILKSLRAEKVCADAIKDHGSPQSFLLNGICFGHPAEGATQDFADAFKLILRGREGFKEIDRMAAVGVADVVFG